MSCRVSCEKQSHSGKNRPTSTPKSPPKVSSPRASMDTARKTPPSLKRTIRDPILISQTKRPDMTWKHLQSVIVARSLKEKDKTLHSTRQLGMVIVLTRSLILKRKTVAKIWPSLISSSTIWKSMAPPRKALTLINNFRRLRIIIELKTCPSSWPANIKLQQEIERPMIQLQYRERSYSTTMHITRADPPLPQSLIVIRKTICPPNLNLLKAQAWCSASDRCT